ncbi:LysE/ArgO family amino acid transporter [Cellulomonas sp. KH9]|uniref:LysE/ArgO family amino acid transporter n=1 Tax=Cellulomonas sp. KH9 TaxID=1855324 RepID=UPI0008ED920C|nr:LysE family transporter [Cellulomonas sp. KH9]SFJ59639.1 L-lysine exporter family protein LysE/ArgO [Cellulomonas sp. KH9]
MWTSALAGLGFGLALIVAIGAQNAHVLRSGLRREHVGLVVAICAVSDLLLIVVGAAGVGTVVAASRPVTVVTVVLGAAVLLTYAAMAARRAVRGDDALVVDGAPDRTAGTAAAAALTTLALTWLNPHVYLDTVVLLGSVAAGHGDARWWFAAGAGVGSVLWFTALGYGARLLRPVFARPAAWRLLDAVIAVVMVGIATGLLADLRAP